MLKKIPFLAIICFLPLCCVGQTVRFSYEPGFGFYNLGRIKAMQHGFEQHTYSFPINAVEKFPNYLNHSMSLDFYLDKNTLFGFNAAFLTTGGRNYSSDYSGVYKLDMLLKAFQFGLESESLYNLTKKLDFYTNFKVGVIQSTLDVAESLILYDLDNQSNSDQVVEYSYFVEPNVGFSYKLNKRIATKVGLGLNWDTGRINRQLIYWSGLRTRIGITYSL